MDCKLYIAEEHTKSNWSGGSTVQLAIQPLNSDYLHRNFIWRLSSAVVELEESDFTRLPDYDRVLMVLQGSVVLSYNEERIVKLNELEQDSFDGGLKTKSFGKITDYNLMIRKGGKGELEVIRPTAIRAEIEAFGEEYNCISLGFYCHQGYAIITVEGGEKPSYMVKEGEQLIVNCEVDNSERVKIGIMGEGVLIKACMRYNQMSLGPEIIPWEKATLQDFKEASKISLTNFRGSKYLFKSLKNQWYDEALKKGIDKIERVFIPFILCMIGTVVVAYYGNEVNGSSGAMVGILLWLLLDFLAITPFVYFMVLPKPIKKHIKELGKLTEYEKKIYEEEINRNDVTERILKKYKITGRNVYTDDLPKKEKSNT